MSAFSFSVSKKNRVTTMFSSASWTSGRLEVVADGLGTTVHCALTGRRDHERHTQRSRSGGISTSERGTVPRAGGSQGQKSFGGVLGWKSEASSANSPGHACEGSSESSAVEQNRLGAFVCAPWCPVSWHGQWRFHCWDFLWLSVRTGTLLWSTMWSVTCWQQVLLGDAKSQF